MELKVTPRRVWTPEVGCLVNDRLRNSTTSRHIHASGCGGTSRSIVPECLVHCLSHYHASPLGSLATPTKEPCYDDFLKVRMYGEFS